MLLIFVSMNKESRRYLGTTITASNYREILEKEGRDGINFHTKHLRAYLKGKKTFRHKIMTEKVLVENEKGEKFEEVRIVRDAFGNPRYHEFVVQQEYIPATNDRNDPKDIGGSTGQTKGN